MALAGYNHDIPYQGTRYHVQTEALSSSAGLHIVSDVYVKGRVVANHRSEWTRSVRTNADLELLAARVRRQHKKAIKCLLIGQLERFDEVLNGARTKLADGSREDWQPKLARVEPYHSATQDLGLRRALVRFVRAVGEGPPEADNVSKRLRSVMTSIAVLVNHEGEGRLRRDELAELMMKRSETQDFLSDTDSDPEAGLELWRSFDHLARAFAPINDRATLRRHDREALAKVSARWSSAKDLERPPGDVSLTLLRSIWGRDAILDELLEDLRGLTVASLLPEVERVAKDLERTLD